MLPTRPFVLRLLSAIALLLSVASCNSSTTPDPAPTPDPVHRPSVALDWNEAMLGAVRNGAPRPTVIARSLYLTSAAMYDAWAMYDTNATPVALDEELRRPAADHTAENQREAVSYAAWTILRELFPQHETSTGSFTTLLNNSGYGVNDTEDPTFPAGIGNLAAKAVLEARADDGSNAANNYADLATEMYTPSMYVAINSPDPGSPNAFAGEEFDCNFWCPLRVPTGSVVDPMGRPIIDPNNPASFTDQNFLTPHWGAVTPFALESGDQFRPPAPPKWDSDEPYTDALGNTMPSSEAFRMQFDQVLAFSAGLTDTHKVIAEYWADGPRSETPPGHWNALAHGISIRDSHSLAEDVQLFLALNGALFDASIAAWDAKRAYNSSRPAAAIRWLHRDEEIQAWGGSGQGTISMPGTEWRPYQSPSFVTPPFADYVSGHSTFSAAAAEVLTSFTSSNQFYDGETVLRRDYNGDGINDLLGEYVAPAGSLKFDAGVPAAPITLRWQTFQEAADEAGISRLYGGIHHQDADLQGRKLGLTIGELAFERARELWTGGQAEE